LLPIQANEVKFDLNFWINIIGMILSLLNIYVGSYLQKFIKFDKDEKDILYNDVKENFWTDYDRTNPLTRDKAMWDWV
jgi:hypothetical protein